MVSRFVKFVVLFSRISRSYLSSFFSFRFRSVLLFSLGRFSFVRRDLSIIRSLLSKDRSLGRSIGLS